MTINAMHYKKVLYMLKVIVNLSSLKLHKELVLFKTKKTKKLKDKILLK